MYRIMTKEDLFTPILPKVLQTIRASSALAAQDVNFYKSIDTALAVELDTLSKALFDLTKRLILVVGEEDVFKFGKENITSDLSWKPVGNLLDLIFEKIDTSIDKFSGKPNNTTNIEEVNIDKHKKIPKPQLQFKAKVDNLEETPFKPKLLEKPNSLEPFSLELFTPTQTTSGDQDVPMDPPYYPHPYEKEIDLQPYNEAILNKAEPIPSTDWKDTTAIWVDTPEKVREMVELLKGSTEIAVDLEHHDYRTYYGIVCLMQISNRDQDWIVDTLILRDDLKPLNEVFTNPQITKVFHGAFMDIIWLQRDLGLYIVSLFDTFHASKALGFPKMSLAYLLETFALFKTSKKYQLADWRIRPLEPAMLSYARSDTHFLLNIFDTLRNKLIEQEKLTHVLFESREVAKRRFEYSKFRPTTNFKNVVCPTGSSDPIDNLMSQYNISNQQRPLVEVLYTWRDVIARKEDESVRFIMSNQLLVSLANLQLPIDLTKVLGSLTFVSDHVRLNALDLASLLESVSVEEEEEAEEEVVDFTAVGVIFDEISKVSTDNALLEEVSLFREVLAKKEVTFEYVDGKVLKHDFSKEKLQRLTNGLAKLRQHVQKHISDEDLQVDSEEDLQDEEEEEEEVEEPPVKTDSKVILDRTLDQNEVISIRKNRTQHNKKVAQEESTPVDYSSSDKILLDGKKKKRDPKNQKKRAFDPYRTESEGPQPAKRAKMINMGKTSTFTKKRK